MAQYWLLDWIDQEEIRSITQAKKLLHEGHGFLRLIERAAKSYDERVTAIPDAYEQVVAGPGFDASGLFYCANPDCITESVDDLIQKVWHYFDHVVVNGLDSRRFFQEANKAKDPSTLIPFLLGHIQVALYVRSIGAEQFLLFSDKPEYCEDHMDKMAAQVGLTGGLTRMTDELAKHLRTGASMEIIEKREDKILTTVTHPDIENLHALTYARQQEGIEFDPNRALDYWSKMAAHQRATALIQTTALARMNNAALGQVGSFDSVYRKYSLVENITAADIALDIQIPFIEGASSKDILKIKEDHYSDFEVFQFTLRQAIKEQLKNATHSNSQLMADEIISDIVNPTLLQIDRKLNRSTESLKKKAAASITVGSIVTTIGLLTFTPLVAPGVVVGAAALLASVHEYIKGNQEIKLSDMYFLWHLASKTAKHS